MQSILAMLPMFLMQFGVQEKNYLLPIGCAFLTKEFARIGLTWTPDKIAAYVGDSIDIAIAEELAAAKLLTAGK